MKLGDLVDVLESIAPSRFAEPWDNVGLLAGDPNQPLTKAVLTIDYSPAVAREAQEVRCDAVIAYHPPIFSPLKRLNAGSLVFDAIRRGVGIYSPHTALDVAEGGTNDMLADALGLADRAPLRLAAAEASANCKLVTFVPPDAEERVAEALFEAGAGRIGEYSRCSFRAAGAGTFFGGEGTRPAVGEPHRLERVDEVRIETVAPFAALPAIIAALRKAHPYEEPAFDLTALAASPSPRGMGRVGRFANPLPCREMLERIKRALGVSVLLVSGPLDRQVRTAACCAGSCGDLLSDAIAAGADLFLTGEMRHHDALRAAAGGMTVICTLHSNSERAILPRLAQRITDRLPDLPLLISARDADPFSVH